GVSVLTEDAGGSGVIDRTFRKKRFLSLAEHMASMTDDSSQPPRPSTPAQDAELTLWRSKALERMPYFAPILFSLRVLDAPGLGTFAVDAMHRLYIDFA